MEKAESFKKANDAAAVQAEEEMEESDEAGKDTSAAEGAGRTS